MKNRLLNRLSKKTANTTKDRTRPRAKLGVESLERRDTPAAITTFSSGELRIAFDENVSTGQSVQISSANGLVTINDRSMQIAASEVRKITVVGSNRDNFIDLRYVSAAAGFRKLDGQVTLQGRGGNDVLIGSQFGDRLSGGAGFDQLYAGAGNDRLDGGAGDDWLYPDFGNDTIIQRAALDWCDRLEPGDRVIRR